MFKTFTTKLTLSIPVSQNILNRTYASIGGKSKILPEDDTFSNNYKARILNNHVQYITDFNIIYENPQDIKLYQIGTLFTKKTDKSQVISSTQNYRLEAAEQNIQFFEKAIPIKSTVHVVKKSKVYFDQPEIKDTVQNTPEFQRMKTQVLEQLRLSKVPHRVAETSAEEMQTGYNILIKDKTTSNVEDESYMFMIKMFEEKQ